MPSKMTIPDPNAPATPRQCLYIFTLGGAEYVQEGHKLTKQQAHNLIDLLKKAKTKSAKKTKKIVHINTLKTVSSETDVLTAVTAPDLSTQITDLIQLTMQVLQATNQLLTAIVRLPAEPPQPPHEIPAPVVPAPVVPAPVIEHMAETEPEPVSQGAWTPRKTRTRVSRSVSTSKKTRVWKIPITVDEIQRREAWRKKAAQNLVLARAAKKRKQNAARN